MNKILGIIGGVLAAIVGVARGVGGVSLLIHPESTSMLLVGCGLLIIAVLLLVSGIFYAVKRSIPTRKSLTVASILFWIDGIINGFILFGSPQLSGQIINLILVILILVCIWYSKLSTDR